MNGASRDGSVWCCFCLLDLFRYEIAGWVTWPAIFLMLLLFGC